MRAIFKGEDGSMGLKFGETYSITSVVRDSYLVINIEHMVRVPYASLEAFLRNWSLVQE